MSNAIPAARFTEAEIERIKESLARTSITTMYGRDAAVAEVWSSQDNGVQYQVLMVVDQGDIQAACMEEARKPCPSQGGRAKWCKHIWASIIAWDREANRAAGIVNLEDGPIPATPD